MKIVVLYLGRKGAGPVYALEMAKALANSHEVVAVLSNYVENKKQWDDNSQIKKYYWNTYKNKKQFLSSLFKFRLFYRLLKSISKENPDVIYSPMPSLWDIFLFPFLKKYVRIKTIHDVELHAGEDGLISKFFHRQSFKHTDKYVILSEKYVAKLTKLGIALDNIQVIPHASFSYYDDDSSKSVFNPSSKKILFFGRIIKYKGVDVLLDALDIVKGQMPDIKLSIVGSGDISNYQKKLNSLSENVELHNRWIQDEEVKSFFQDVSLLVVPYIKASQSGVIPLSYSLGVPVLATDVGCISEQIVNGKTGILIPPNDIKLLAQTIIDLLAEPNELKRLGNSAQEYAKDKLSWEYSAELLTDLIK